MKRTIWNVLYSLFFHQMKVSIHSCLLIFSVSADAPGFDTDVVQAQMTVVGESSKTGQSQLC